MNDNKPSVVNAAELRFSGEKMRLCGHKELIDASDFVQTYLNHDGTKTMYIFTAPMERNEILLRREETGYCRKGDFFEVRIPETLSADDGIDIGGIIKIYPVNDEKYSSEFRNKTNAFGMNAGCVTYRDFFGQQMDLDCYATCFGVNYEITIPKYTGKNIFRLKVKHTSDGLFALTDSPDYIVFRTEDDLISMVYTPLMVDAAGKWDYRNHVSINENYADNSCVITFILNDEFLSSPDTVFPVTLNQSVYPYKPKQSDTAMYSGTADTGTHHLSPYMLLGDSTSKGEGWGFTRFEELYGMDIPANIIISSEYFFNNLFDLDKEIRVGAFAIVNDWCSVNTRWRTKPGYDKVPVKTVRVRDKGIYSIDITRLFTEMMRNKNVYEPPYSLRNSFFIRSLTKDTGMLLAAGDSGLFSPYLKIVVK